MSIYSWIIENKEIIKIFYALIVVIICAVIVRITHRLFHLSLHHGIRYFRNAFLFYGLGFTIRYLIGNFAYMQGIPEFLIKNIFEFFLVMAGFFLVYSLLWKKVESPTEHSSLFNARIFLFYIMAFIIALLDSLWNTFYFMFFSQIILFTFALIVSFRNFRKSDKQKKFFKLYFIAILLSFVSWSLNTVAAFFNWDQRILLNVYGVNMLFFLLLLYTIIRVTRIKKLNN